MPLRWLTIFRYKLPEIYCRNLYSDSFCWNITLYSIVLNKYNFVYRWYEATSVNPAALSRTALSLILRCPRHYSLWLCAVSFSSQFCLSAVHTALSPQEKCKYICQYSTCKTATSHLSLRSFAIYRKIVVTLFLTQMGGVYTFWTSKISTNNFYFSQIL